MKTISITSKTGPDGVLKLSIPTSDKEVDVEVVIVIQPQHRIKKTWPKGFITSTYGCFKNDPLKRPSQGDYPVREQLV